jgi:uncharacterized protein (DUF2147 family)
MRPIKKVLLHCSLLIMGLLTLSQLAKAQADRLEGLWYNDVKSGKILITRGADGKFSGKVVWLKEPNENGKPKVDRMNEDPKLRSRPRLGLQVLTGFEKDGDDKYTGGTIYDPLNGKTYSCKITYKGNTLDIRGYIGISLFGRTTVWSRAEQ